MESQAITTKSSHGEVRVVGDCVVVTLTSTLDLAAIEAMINAIDAALQQHGLLRVLVDRRRAAPPLADAEELFQAWIEDCVYHDRVAVLVASDGQAPLEQAHVRSFCEPKRAVEWLREASPPARKAV